MEEEGVRRSQESSVANPQKLDRIADFLRDLMTSGYLDTNLSAAEIPAFLEELARTLRKEKQGNNPEGAD